MPSPQAMKVARDLDFRCVLMPSSANRLTEVAEIIDAAFAPEWLAAPDGPGRWYIFANGIVQESPVLITHTNFRQPGAKWCRATPPAPPKVKGD